MKYKDLTIAEAERLIQCKDENGEYLCNKGCIFHFTDGFIGCCYKNAFLGNLYSYCKGKNILKENKDGELEIDISRG